MSECSPYRARYLLKCSLNINALAPGCWWVGQTFSSISTARYIYPLPAEVLEGCGHDFDPIICESSSILHKE